MRIRVSFKLATQRRYVV